MGSQVKKLSTYSFRVGFRCSSLSNPTYEKFYLCNFIFVNLWEFINPSPCLFVFVLHRGIYPADRAAKAAINLKIELAPGTGDDTFLAHLHGAIPKALDSFKPDMVLYNAGTDILINDRLGALNITREGVISRDEMVWKECRERQIPILMVTSGGYQSITGRIVADSIINLQSKGFLK